MQSWTACSHIRVHIFLARFCSVGSDDQWDQLKYRGLPNTQFNKLTFFFQTMASFRPRWTASELSHNFASIHLSYRLHPCVVQQESVIKHAWSDEINSSHHDAHHITQLGSSGTDWCIIQCKFMASPADALTSLHSSVIIPATWNIIMIVTSHFCE